MKSLFKSLFILFLAGSATLATAQDADDIIKDYLKAVGGADKLSAITSMKMVGKASSPMGDSEMTMIKMAPNKNKMLINAAGTLMTMAYDGDIAWMINPWAGGAPTKLEGDQAKRVPQEEIEDPFLNYSDKGHTVKFLGEEDINDETHNKVRLTKKSGEEMVYYFNADSYLPTQMKMLLTEGQAKGSILVSTFGDYKEVDGVKLPHLSETTIDGNMLSKFVIEEITINLEIADSEFAFPEGK